MGPEPIFVAFVESLGFAAVGVFRNMHVTALPPMVGVPVGTKPVRAMSRLGSNSASDRCIPPIGLLIVAIALLKQLAKIRVLPSCGLQVEGLVLDADPQIIEQLL